MGAEKDLGKTGGLHPQMNNGMSGNMMGSGGGGQGIDSRTAKYMQDMLNDHENRLE